MSHEEQALRRPDQGEGTGPDAFDHDVHLRPVLWLGVFLAGAMVVVAVVVWWMMAGFERYDARRDPELSPIERQVQAPAEPPAPRLQPSPERDLREMRADEEERLGRAAWVDRARGTVRIPVEVAIDAYLAGARAEAGSAPPPGAGSGVGQPGSPTTGAGSVGAPLSGVQPLEDAEVRRPRPATEEAPPPW